MSTLKADTLVASDGTSPVTLTKQSAAKVFCQFDGDAGTPAPNESINVSSITDNGTGDYTLTFSNAMSSDNHASMGTRQWSGVLMHDAYTTTTCQYISRNAGGTTKSDSYNTATATFGDLA